MAEMGPATKAEKMSSDGILNAIPLVDRPKSIRSSIKEASASLNTTASQVLETAAKEWLERQKSKKA